MIKIDRRRERFFYHERNIETPITKMKRLSQDDDDDRIESQPCFAVPNASGVPYNLLCIVS